MQLLSEFAPYIAGAAAGVSVLAAIGFAVQKRRSQKRIKADLRYEVVDGPIRRNLELRTSYADTNELIDELRRVADGLQDEIIHFKTGARSQKDFNILVGVAAGIVGIVASGGDVELPSATVPIDDGMDPNPIGPLTDLPLSEPTYIPRDPSAWGETDQKSKSGVHPYETGPDLIKHAAEKRVEELRLSLCKRHKEQAQGAVMLAYIEPDSANNFEGGILDVRYDLPSSLVQSHFSRIERYLKEFGEFVSSNVAGLESGNDADIELLKRLFSRACKEFHESLPLINSVVDFGRDGGLNEHIVSEFRIYRDLATNNVSAKKTQQRLKDHRRLAIADSALDAAEHLPVGFGCLVGMTALFYGTFLTMRVRLDTELRAKKSGSS